MRLISLTANKDSFRPIYFNKTGLSLIVGKQKAPQVSGKEKTYNGVGKSLAIILIHFCLGAKKNPVLESEIPGWEFTLKFELNDKIHILTRGTSTQEKIQLNGEDLPYQKVCGLLESMAFLLQSPVKNLTFRSLLPRFIRPRKESYVSFDTVGSEETPYARLLRNAFLLGIEIDPILRKHELVKERARIKTFRDNLRKDSVFLEFFTGNKNADIELKDIEDKVSQLARNLNDFKVAENYYAIEQEANSIAVSLQGKKNRAIIVSNAIKNIDQSLQMPTDVSAEKLIKVYEEANAALPNLVVKQVQEVMDFHDKLMRNRIKRLSAEKAKFERELNSLTKEISSISDKLNESLQFLGAHGALDQFVDLTNALASLQAKAQKLKDYKALIKKYNDDTQEINLHLINETKRANDYIKDATSLLEDNLTRFREFSKQLYPDKAGGLIVTNNDGENQLRYNIDAHIQDDASDGINEVKIFCFDMTILLGKHNHHMNFLFHDSRLFSDIDPRQRATLFKIAHTAAQKANVQYIATVNEDQITSIKDLLSENEFKEIITDSIVLELTDDSAASKLLGVQVDMHY